MQRRCATLALALLTACGGGGGSSSLPTTGGGSHTLGKTTLTLRVNAVASSAASAARRTTIASAGRKPQYLSPSTQSLVYVISQNGTPVTNGSGYVNLTTASTYCSSDGAGQALVCTTQIPITVTTTGTYDFNVATYDQPQTAPCVPGGTPACAGNVLSNQTLPQTLTVDAANTVTLALGGDATSIKASPLTPGYLQGDAHGLKLWGPNAQKIAVNALDADGNVIVGLGAPTVALTSGSSTLTATAVTNAPNIFTLQAQTSGGLVTPGIVNLTVALTAPTTGGGSIPANTTVPVTIAHSIIYISDGSSTVYEYEDGATTTATTTITGLNGPVGVAVNANGTLYVANYFGGTSGTVTEYPAGSTTATTTISNSLGEPYGVAVDANGTLYVANELGGANGTVTEYPAGSATATTSITNGVNGPYGVAVNANGTLYVANAYGGTSGTVTEYPAGSTTAATIIPSTSGVNVPFGVAVDASGTLYVANAGNNTVTEYPAGSATATTSITNGVNSPYGVAVDANGTLYVANYLGDTVTEYPAGSTTAATTITLGYLPFFIAIVPASVQP